MQEAQRAIRYPYQNEPQDVDLQRIVVILPVFARQERQTLKTSIWVPMLALPSSALAVKHSCVGFFRQFARNGAHAHLGATTRQAGSVRAPIRLRMTGSLSRYASERSAALDEAVLPASV